MVAGMSSVDEAINKLSVKVVEYEMILADLKQSLASNNIRRVYRMLTLSMPEELEAHLVKTGAILWDEFTKSAINKFDIKAVMSQQLGFFNTGLCVLPPINSLYNTSAIENGRGGFFENQLDLQ